MSTVSIDTKGEYSTQEVATAALAIQKVAFESMPGVTKVTHNIYSTRYDSLTGGWKAYGSWWLYTRDRETASAVFSAVSSSASNTMHIDRKAILSS
jgi:hypothetical protein